MIPLVIWCGFPFFVNSPLLLGGRLPKNEKNESFWWYRFLPIGGIISIGVITKNKKGIVGKTVLNILKKLNPRKMEAKKIKSSLIMIP